MKTLFLSAAFAALSFAADPPKAEPVPVINTAKFWRLTAKATSTRQELQQVEAQVQQEIAALAAKCGASHILSYQQDPNAENAGDVICVAKPKPAEAPKAPEKK